MRPQRLTDDQLRDLTELLRTALPPAPHHPSPATTMTGAGDLDAACAAYSKVPVATSPETGPVIRVLGHVDVGDVAPATGGLSPRMKETLVYLALHGPTTGADLDDALWNGARISSGTRNALIYRLRQRVGEQILPRIDSDGLYRLGPRVTTDWAQFQQGVAAALEQTDPDAQVAHLQAALELVRDRPFKGLAPTEYTWADHDIQCMDAAIADAALILATHLHKVGRHREAFDAAVRGMIAEPFSAPLQQVAIDATKSSAGTGQAAALQRAYAEDLAALDPESV